MRPHLTICIYLLFKISGIQSADSSVIGIQETKVAAAAVRPGSGFTCGACDVNTFDGVYCCNACVDSTGANVGPTASDYYLGTNCTGCSIGNHQQPVPCAQCSNSATTCPFRGLAYIWRYTLNGDHFYSLYNSLATDGVVMEGHLGLCCTVFDLGSGRVVLQEYTKGAHRFYTTSVAEGNVALLNGYYGSSSLCYVDGTPKVGITYPVQRFVHPGLPTDTVPPPYLLTMNPYEIEGNSYWQFNGTVFHLRLRNEF